MQESQTELSLEVGEDIQNILKILPEGIDAKWLNKHDFYKYVQKLGSLDLQQLQKEKIKLTEECGDIGNQTQGLAIENYTKFIETAENTRNIYKQFELTESHLDQLIEKLPAFDKHCKKFTNESDDISSHRKSSTLMFNKTQQLTALLELPELMEASIADGNYEDALEVVDFIRRLQHKHPDIKIFSVLLDDVEKLWLIIIQKLLAQLRSDIQLPKCLQAVGYLRCMNIFTEAELRLKFLQTRDTWLQSLLDEIPKDKASHHLAKTIELSRVHIFHIITQYNAIFCDDNQTAMLKNDVHINESAIFQSWIQEKTSQFLRTMEQDLAECDGTSFSSTLSQCMYFGLSFSKVGCDFRGLAAPIICACIEKHFQQSIQSATTKLKNDMDCFTLINKVYSTVKKDLDNNKLVQVQEFYPLAVYCNGILQAFNDLRVCAPVQLVCSITKSIEQSLHQVSNVILQFYQQEHQAFSDVANEQFSCFCKCFVYELIPHIQTCLKSVYPPIQIATHLGVTVQYLEKGKYLTFDRDFILEPIKHLLPLNIEFVEDSITTSEESNDLIIENQEEQVVDQQNDSEKLEESLVTNDESNML